MTSIPIGYLLRASTTGFVAGCRVAQFESDAPSLGTLVRVPIGERSEAYGLIYDVHIDDDGLVRQLVTAEDVDLAVIADNRENRSVPVELSVLAVGHRREERISHLLPPRPPLSLDMICLCTPDEVRQFSSVGRFGYFRHILRAVELPTGDVLAAHLQQANAAHLAAGNRAWISAACRELITLLRDDYATLMAALTAISDL